MAKMQKHMASTVRVIITTLVIGFIIVGILVAKTMNKDSRADIRSQASQASALQVCTSRCTNPANSAFIKNPGACALDCSKVTSGTMSCANFCNAHIKGGSNAKDTCISQCNTWRQNNPPTTVFSDVPGDHWAATYITRIYMAGITAGCATNPLKFCPDKPATRGEVVALILKGKYGLAFAHSGPGSFSDVPSTHQFHGFIQKAYEDGITAGCATNPLKFCPDSPATRGEVARMFVNLKYGRDFTPPAYRGTFTDVPQTHPHALMIEKFEADDNTVGCSTSPKKYCPDKPVTRAEMAVFLSKFFDLP